MKEGRKKKRKKGGEIDREGSQMEHVVLTGVPLLEDIETTRRAVMNCCAVFGEVGDVVISRAGNMASVGFLDPTSAQSAVVKLNGTFFCGRIIYAHIAPPPRTWLPGYAVTMQTSRTVLVEDESYLRVFVKLKRCLGVASLTSVRRDACLVVADNPTAGLYIKRHLSAHLNRKGKPVSAVFLKKEE